MSARFRRDALFWYCIIIMKDVYSTLLLREDSTAFQRAKILIIDYMNLLIHLDWSGDVPYTSSIYCLAILILPRAYLPAFP